MSAAVTSVARTRRSGRYQPVEGTDELGVYQYARMQRLDILRHIGRLPEIMAPYLTAGVAISGLEAEGIPYHPQELLAMNEVISLDNDTSWEPDPTLSGVFLAMGEEKRIRAGVLLDTGLLIGSATISGVDPEELSARHRGSIAQDAVDEAQSVDWDGLLRRLTESGGED